MKSNEGRVLECVERLTEDKEGELFARYVSAGRVATELGISESTARKWLEYHRGCRRIRRAWFRGAYGYRGIFYT